MTTSGEIWVTLDSHFHADRWGSQDPDNCRARRCSPGLPDQAPAGDEAVDLGGAGGRNPAQARTLPLVRPTVDFRYSVKSWGAKPLARAAGDSAEQRSAEVLLVARLGRLMGVSLAKRRIALPSGGWLEVDGASNSPPILCEAWAHYGLPKSAQKAKVMKDAFKLCFAASLVPKAVEPLENLEGFGTKFGSVGNGFWTFAEGKLGRKIARLIRQMVRALLLSFRNTRFW
jgi:hypothetical protein